MNHKLPTLSQIALEAKDALNQRIIKVTGYMDEIEHISQTVVMSRSRLRIHRPSAMDTFSPDQSVARFYVLQDLVKGEQRAVRVLVWEILTAIGLSEEATVLEHHWQQKRDARRASTSTTSDNGEVRS